MTRIYCETGKTGEIVEVTSLVTAAKWQTVLSGAPGRMTMTLAESEGLSFLPGGIVTLHSGGQGLFYGYIFSIGKNESGSVELLAYDQLRYLKNCETYVFSGRRADEIVKEVAADFKLKAGELKNTGYAIPSVVSDGQSLFDLFLTALDATFENTGKTFFLWDDYGSLRLSATEDEKLPLILGDKSLATGFTYTEEIDSETYNQIKLVKENGGGKKRNVIVSADEETQRAWGVLQYFEKVDRDMNDAQIKKQAEAMLKSMNKPDRSFDLSALSDLSVRAGRSVRIQLDRLGMEGEFLAEEVGHDLLSGTMTLKLKGEMQRWR